MTRFAACFLLVFGQLAVGGVAGLAVPPFAALERGFYKSSAGVYLGCALLYLAGAVTLAFRQGAWGIADGVRLALWAAFAAALAAYLAALWGEAPARRARAYVASLGLGLAALAASAVAYRPGALLAAATVFYPLAFVSGALVLGGVSTGMLLGHWYLIDVGLSIAPLRRLLRYVTWTLVLQLGLGAFTLAGLALLPGPGAAAVGVLWREHRALLALRVALGPAAALGTAALIRRTLAIPQTMAATGLFYVAVLAVLSGEMLGRLILFRTSLPL
ncbi:MAG TPA: hypothetical protein VKW76_00795 [Candidatus Binatia bacterium]|nr:hypothetical protein [Candidatus Binatia bacterium]